MIRIGYSLSAAVLVAAAFLVSAQASSSRVTGLRGEVGPGFEIEVKKNNRDLKTLRAGTHTIKVQDKASIHNFHLKGPGVNKKTGVGFKGTVTWKIKFRKGTYRYMCDPHRAQMHGSFRVT